MLCLSLFLIACSSIPPASNLDEHDSRLTVAENLWQSKKITDYQYRSKSSGRSDNPYNPFPKVFSKSQKEPDVEKLIGAIIQIKNNTYSYSYYENDPGYEANYYGGFNKAFKSIREMLEVMKSEPGLFLEVDYHPIYGYPTRMVSRQYSENRLVSISFDYNDQFQVLNNERSN